MKKVKHQFEYRPKCTNGACTNDCQFMGTFTKDGTPRFRKICSKCHGASVAAKHGMNSIAEVLAKKAGYTSVADHANSRHPYRKHRKTFCENEDGRLGFKCTTTIMLTAQLEVDHIDGNPTHNEPENLQTLCSCCHKYKTIKNGDNKTPGRKHYGVTY